MRNQLPVLPVNGEDDVEDQMSLLKTCELRWKL